MFDLTRITQAVREQGFHKVAFEVERLSGGVSIENASPLVVAVTAIGAKYAQHALDARRVMAGVQALTDAKE